MDQWITGQFQAVVSKELRDEVNTVLKRTKIINMDAKRRILLDTLFNQALMVLPQPIPEIVFPDPDDHFLLELAVPAQASIIVTGDKKLSALKKVKGIEVLSPQSLCRRIKLK